MKYRELWKLSSDRMQQQTALPAIAGSKLFTGGARWMHARLDDMRNTSTAFNEQCNFAFYGWMKYSVLVAVSVPAALLLYSLHPLLLPLAIPLFYFCEVQLLFLFPLLIDGVPNPVYSSIKQTAAIGTWRAMKTVMPVGMLMLAGLFNCKAPLRNWYTGCLAVLIWYQHEIRNRHQ